MAEDLKISIDVDAAPEVAFDRILDIAGWWGRITGTTTDIGDEFVYVVPGVHYSGFRVSELTPAETIEWEVTGSYLSFVAEKQEWNGSRLRFDITPTAAGSAITFTHRGLSADDECYDACSNAWSMYIRGSLTQYVNTGTGSPNYFEGDTALDAVALRDE